MFIPNSFFDNHLKLLNGDSIKLYLYRLYYGRCDDIEQLGCELNITKNQLSIHIDHLSDLNLWNRCFRDYIDDLQSVEFPLFLYSGNCELGQQTKEWLSFMPIEEFNDLTRTIVHKYESTILYVDQFWDRYLSIEYIFLILYLGERLDLSPLVIKYIFASHRSDQRIDNIESAAIFLADFDLNDIYAIEYYYSNGIYFFKAVKEIFLISKPLSFNDMTYIVDWCVHSRFSLEFVIFACLYTKSRIDQFAVAYADKVLTSWMNADIGTTDDVINQRKIRNIPLSEQRLLQQQARKLANDIQNTPIEELII